MNTHENPNIRDEDDETYIEEDEDMEDGDELQPPALLVHGAEHPQNDDFIKMKSKPKFRGKMGEDEINDGEESYVKVRIKPKSEDEDRRFTVTLDADVAAVFGSTKAVNQILRAIINCLPSNINSNHSNYKPERPYSNGGYTERRSSGGYGRKPEGGGYGGGGGYSGGGYGRKSEGGYSGGGSNYGGGGGGYSKPRRFSDDNGGNNNGGGYSSGSNSYGGGGGGYGDRRRKPEGSGGGGDYGSKGGGYGGYKSNMGGKRKPRVG